MLRGAEEDVQKQVTILDSICLKITYQLQIIRKLIDAEKIDEGYAKIQNDVLNRAAKSMSLAVQQLEDIAQGGNRVKILTYLKRKGTLDNAIKELKEWEKCYDPTWYLVVVLVKEWSLDEQLPALTCDGLAENNPLSKASALRRIHRDEAHGTSTPDTISVTLDTKAFETGVLTSISYTNIRLMTQTSGSKKRLFLVDDLNCDQYLDKNMARGESQALAQRLKLVDRESSGLLACQGLVRRKSSEGVLQHIHLLFRFRGTTPKSLREQLLDEHDLALDQALDIARRLAQSVNFIHVCGFVHKNVRPENIVTTYHESGPDGQSAFLLGFTSFRNANFQTLRVGDSSIVANLYRHPSRQGLNTQAVYTMQHDIYSLGVCLLELGIRQSFITYSDNDSTGKLSDAVDLGDHGPGWTEWPKDVGERVKNQLENLAQELLPARMGERYTKVVMTCLT